MTELNDVYYDAKAHHWTKNLKGFLTMTDGIMRMYGDDEKIFKEHIATFMWDVVQANLSATTDARDENEVEHCGTTLKFKGEPGISHLIADAYPRRTLYVDAFNSERQETNKAGMGAGSRGHHGEKETDTDGE